MDRYGIERDGIKCKLILLLALTIGAHTLGHAAPIQITGPLPAPNVAHAVGYNATFESTPAEGYDWSGGDHGISVKLPYCATCMSGKKNRRLWFFGDTYHSYAEADGRRYKTAPPSSTPGFDTSYGNSIAITYHPDNAPPNRASVKFDWGDLSQNFYNQAWLPITSSFLTSAGQLPDMHPMRATLNGYPDMGFTPALAQDIWVYPGPGAMPDPNDPSSLIKRDDLTPIYEYYVNAPGEVFSYYMPIYNTSGFWGFEYRGVAFYVLTDQAPGSVKLYRYFSPLIRDVLLSTNPDITAYGFQKQGFIGYVYTTSTLPSDAAEVKQLARLYSHFRNPEPQNGHHKYTVRPNDDGIQVVNWPLNGVAIYNDLILTTMPIRTPGIVLGNPPDTQQGLFEQAAPNIFTIIRDVNLPIESWGKSTPGGWNTQPSQHVPFGVSDIRWGVSFVKHSDFASNGILYIYGARAANEAPQLPINTRQLYLARATTTTVDDVVDPLKWEFYDGVDWSDFEGDAKPLVVSRNVSGTDVEQGISSVTAPITIVPGPNENWVMSMSNDYLPSDKVSIAAASDVTGPWTVVADLSIRDVLPHEDAKPAELGYYTIALHDDQALGGPQSGLLMSFTRSANCWLYSSLDPLPVFCQGSPPEIETHLDVYIEGFMDMPWSTVFPVP